MKIPFTAFTLASLGLIGTTPSLLAGQGGSCCKPASCCGKSEPTADTPTTKSKPYPLDTCIVSGEKLGGMGKPVAFDHKGQEIKLCCKSCRKDFDKEPEKYLQKLTPKE